MDITPALSIRLQWTARPIIEPPSESPKHLQPTIPATVWPCGACAASCCARACAGEVALICGRWASVALILLRFGAVLSYRSLDLWEELELEGRCITKTARLSKPFCSFEEMFKQIPVPHHQDIYIYMSISLRLIPISFYLIPHSHLSIKGVVPCQTLPAMCERSFLRP